MIDDAPFVLGVDLDGVCMDYYGAMKPYAAAWMGRSPETLPDDVSYGFKEWEIDKSGGYDSLHQYLLDNRFFVDAPPGLGSCPQLACGSLRIPWRRSRTYTQAVVEARVAAVGDGDSDGSPSLRNGISQVPKGRPYSQSANGGASLLPTALTVSTVYSYHGGSLMLSDTARAAMRRLVCLLTGHKPGKPVAVIGVWVSTCDRCGRTI